MKCFDNVVAFFICRYWPIEPDNGRELTQGPVFEILISASISENDAWVLIPEYRE